MRKLLLIAAATLVLGALSAPVAQAQVCNVPRQVNGWNGSADRQGSGQQGANCES
jgi:hypothetical protein